MNTTKTIKTKQKLKKYNTREKLDFNVNYHVSSTLLLLPVSDYSWPSSSVTRSPFHQPL
ncbi:hypothetical protein SLEP1_g9419 [Rubroshorea leprosula]|uniref:Uncharacterized protein n=1 Tax=Rubroshorea leprosula TaxID=152421 RepID=A0AAV5IAV4_9ROSI|nr:hypothetical protein SLEP1_g9419 [Rubroshorea leprosula]